MSSASVVDLVFLGPPDRELRIGGALPLGNLVEIWHQPLRGVLREQAFVVRGETAKDRLLCWRLGSSHDDLGSSEQFVFAPLTHNQWLALLGGTPVHRLLLEMRGVAGVVLEVRSRPGRVGSMRLRQCPDVWERAYPSITDAIVDVALPPQPGRPVDDVVAAEVLARVDAGHLIRAATVGRFSAFGEFVVETRDADRIVRRHEGQRHAQVAVEIAGAV